MNSDPSSHIYGYGDPHHKPSILQTITKKRIDDVEQSRSECTKEGLNCRMEEQDKKYGAPINLYDHLIDFYRKKSFHKKIREVEEEEITNVGRGTLEPANKRINIALAAEFKRASPSKGDIAPHLVASEQGLKYASVGASVISVLTEPTWFKGSLEDMQSVRDAVHLRKKRFIRETKQVQNNSIQDFIFSDATSSSNCPVLSSLENESKTILASASSNDVGDQSSSFPLNENKMPFWRPAILRKDFLVDEYQLYEARAHGADTVLLIVAILPADKLERLITISRELLMEPLVEVNNEEEMCVALKAGGKVIGVNNRNLHNFKLDLNTTSRIAQFAKERGYNITPWEEENFRCLEEKKPTKDILIAALSGISSNQDVQEYKDLGISMILVGETLMRAVNPKQMIEELLTDPSNVVKNTSKDTDKSNNYHAATSQNGKNTIVKVCGITNKEDASIALSNGANFIGVIFCASKRQVTLKQAEDIVQTVRLFGERSGPLDFQSLIQTTSFNKQTRTLAQYKNSHYLSSHLVAWANLLEQNTRRTPLVVGVFQNTPIVEVAASVSESGVDIVQLHGDENGMYIHALNRLLGNIPVIKVLHVNVEGLINDKEKENEDFDSNRLTTNILKQVDDFIESYKLPSPTINNKVPTQAQNSTLGANSDHTGGNSEGLDEGIRVKETSLDGEYLKSLPLPVAFILDTSVGNTKGGTGKTFDWSIVESLHIHGIPCIVAGGLTPENIADLISNQRPKGVDVSGGIESSPGKKDSAKLQNFLKNIRST